MVYLCTAFLAIGRSYGADRSWLLPGLLGLGGVAFVVVRDGLRGVFIAGPITGSVTLTAFLIGSLYWAQVLGLPRPIAIRLGIGLLSRALVFNNRLIDHRRRVADAIRLAQTDPPRRAAALAEMTVHIRRVRDLRAPDSAWSLLRDDIADDEEGWIQALRDAEPSERLAEQARASGPLRMRWEQMAAQAAQDQRELATPTRRRRAEAVWLATLGASCLALGLAVGRGYDPLALHLTDLDVWVTLVQVVGGCLLLGGALVVSLRR